MNQALENQKGYQSPAYVQLSDESGGIGNCLCGGLLEEKKVAIRFAVRFDSLVDQASSLSFQIHNRYR
jgi:hypothetical protein